jgi:hypothetical protein
LRRAAEKSVIAILDKGKGTGKSQQKARLLCGKRR